MFKLEFAETRRTLIEEKCSQVVMLAEQRQRRRYRVSCESSLLIKLDHSWMLGKGCLVKKESTSKVIETAKNIFVLFQFLNYIYSIN